MESYEGDLCPRVGQYTLLKKIKFKTLRCSILLYILKIIIILSIDYRGIGNKAT